MSNVTVIDETINKLNIIKSIYEGTDEDLRVYTLLDEEGLVIIAQETILNIHKLSKVDGFINGVVSSAVAIGVVLWLKGK